MYIFTIERERERDIYIYMYILGDLCRATLAQAASISVHPTLRHQPPPPNVSLYLALSHQLSWIPASELSKAPEVAKRAPDLVGEAAPCTQQHPGRVLILGSC